MEAENARLNTLLHAASQKTAEDFDGYIKEARQQTAMDCVEFVTGMAVFPYRQTLLGVAASIKDHFGMGE